MRGMGRALTGDMHRASVLLALGCALLAACDRAVPPRPSDTSVVTADSTPLRVCADPNNLPYSDAARLGFENQIAELVGSALHRPIEYLWWAQRRGFVRNTLRARRCDVILGVPTTMDMVLATRPYYRSTYVFVQRRDAAHIVRSFDDAALRGMRIGVQFVGDDYTNTPPAHALASRGIVRNVTGYSVYGDYGTPTPAARVMDAVRLDSVDLAVVWGPLAGFVALADPELYRLTPVSPQIDLPFLPFVYDISMGVRRDDPGLKAALDRVIETRAASIDSILAAYGVPRVTAATDRD